MSWVRFQKNLLSTIVVLAVAAFAGAAAAEELALIDDIVVDGQRPEEPTAENLTIAVAATGALETGRRGMGLHAGDEVRTGEGVQAVLRFLEVEGDVDPLVIVDQISTYQITGSTSLTGILGRLFTSVAGLFSVIMPGGTLGVRGTEFQVELASDGSLDVEVLEGVVLFEPASLEEEPPTEESERPAAPAPAGEPGPARPPATVPPPTAAAIDPAARPQAVIDRQRAAELRRRLLEARALEAERLRRGEADATRPLRIQALERLTLKGDAAAIRPEKMAKRDVASSLGWSGDVLVAVQPTYAAAGDAPHFSSVEKRSEVFRAARFKAVWDGDPKALARLGNVYKDWGENRRASKAYQEAAAADAELEKSADFVASWAEANRRAGRLEKAEEQARLAVELDSSSARANVARGNVYRSLASKAEEDGDEARQQVYLNLSVEAYRIASDSGGQSGEEKARQLKGVAETNLAQVYTVLASSALAKGETAAAEQQLGEAEKAVAAAEAVYGKAENPFLYLAEGQLLQERARLAKASGKEEDSRAQLDMAQRTYEAALEKHADLAPAQYRIATVYEDKGDTRQAEIEHQKAVEKEPTYSPSYKSLGRIKEVQSPGSGTVYINRDQKLVAAQKTALRTGGGSKMPDFECWRAERAVAALREMGLDPATSGEGPQVVRQSPGAGTEIGADTSVKLRLGRCPG